MQIKTTLRDLLTPIKMALIKKKASNKFWRGCKEGSPPTLLVGMQTDTVTLENSMEIS